MKITLLARIAPLLAAVSLNAAERFDPLKPYDGPIVRGVDTSTLTGKVMTGYQGWFNCEGDGADLGWVHWSRGKKQAAGPDNVRVDLWPDVSEYAPEELFATDFKLADGSPAKLFSSYNRATVMRHFQWMRDYGIDGAFVQRFANGLGNNDAIRHQKDVVLAHAREGANRSGRAYAVMYDLSGLPAGGVARVLDDWKMLHERMAMGQDPAYLRHHGKPLVAVWGVGFNDDRKYSLAECRSLVEGLKADGCSVMLGVPSGWRELKRDSIPDAALHDVLKLADVISPWTPGRYQNPAAATRHGEKYWKPDIAWCRQQSLDFLPVVFPGFSWHNMKPESPLGQIPRLKGEFFWSQFVAAKAAGASMIYVAMFDEVDEGTAIFKCTNHPPGPTQFLTYEGLPSDHYLWLTGQGAALLSGKLPLQTTVPVRNP